MTTTETKVLEPGITGAGGLPDKEHVASAAKSNENRDEQQAREAAKLRPEREAKISDYYVSKQRHLALCQ
jgi:hypothetical protein